MTNSTNRIDLQALALLEAMTPPGVTYSQQEIADIAGCSKANIHQAELRGKKQIRKKLGSMFAQENFGCVHHEE